jgi:transposase, IS5 family
MQAKKNQSNFELYRSHLEQIINLNHPLVKLAKDIDWSVFEREFSKYYSEDWGRPAKSVRLLVGLHYLKHAFNESDESVVARFLENPYWQYFCGFEYFQQELPLDPTTLVKWRQRVGAEGLELLLKETVETAKRRRLLKKSDCQRVNVDTTVQEKAVAYPTDAKLYHEMREKLVLAAQKHGLKLRQSYTRKSKKTHFQQNRLRQTSQHKKADKMTKKLKIYLGCVVRDIQRKKPCPDAQLAELLEKAKKILSQERNSKHKLYSIHAPEVECISKGKSHKKYEFGCKVGMVSTSRKNWIISSQAFHGNPYDGHTLQASLRDAEEKSNVTIKHVHVDGGYRKHDYCGSAQVHITGKGNRPKSRWDKLWQRRRAAIEPVISHAKHDNRMIRNYLKGIVGDKINALLAACGYNFRKLCGALPIPKFFVRIIQNFIRFSLIGSISSQNGFKPILIPIF